MKLSSLIKVISNGIIKPSSPTTTQLRHYQLSFFDQIIPPMYISPIYFYEKNNAYSKFSINSAAKSSALKQSLSNILKHYYPLAGRLKDNNLSVDCNDEGVLYREAEVKCQLSDIVAEPNPTEMKKFLPCDNDGRTPFTLYSSSQPLHLWWYCHWHMHFPQDCRWLILYQLYEKLGRHSSMQE